MDMELGGTDVGRDIERDLGDAPPAALRDAPPDYLAPIDADAPVSGHVPPPEPVVAITETPEQDWGRAKEVLYPAFRPVGTLGLPIETLDRNALVEHGSAQHHSQPLLDEGPAGLPVVYTMDAGGFDIVVNGDHFLTWGVEPGALQDAAVANLAKWAANAPWTVETSGERRLISSQTGDGYDAARILLPETLAHLTRELSPFGRILVGLPERHLLTAAALTPGDDEFAVLFADFIVEQSGGADEPIDRRVFELVDGRLIEFVGQNPGL
jgi:hypothetical protein